MYSFHDSFSLADTDEENVPWPKHEFDDKKAKAVICIFCGNKFNQLAKTREKKKGQKQYVTQH